MARFHVTIQPVPRISVAPKVKVMKIKVLFLLTLFLAGSYCTFAQSESKPVWNPKKTWVFFVGLVEWKDSETYASFPQKDRQDDVFLQLLKSRGVPPSQIISFKDKQATLAKVRAEFAKFVARPQKDDWLIVYWEGHGDKDDGGRNTVLVPWDANQKAPGWPVREVPDTIERSFKGSRAVIMVD